MHVILRARGASHARGANHNGDGAVAAYRYASASFRTADEWVALGGAAWAAEDDAAGAAAYA